jgi:ketosteroid isomerase-like protein
MAIDHIVTDPAVRCEIEALITEHAWMLDHHESSRLAELYTENGRITGIGPERIGRAAIDKYGKERAKMIERKARHVCTNIRLVKKGEKLVHGLCTITLFRYDGDVMGNADPVALADAEDVFVQCEDGRWRFAARHLVLTFESAAHRS